MQIAVIGTGNVGQALGSSFLRAGHQVTFAAQDAEKTRKIAAELRASAAPSVAAAVAAADVIVLAVPYAAVKGIAAYIASAAAGKVVIDATNPLKADFSGLATEGGPSAAELLAAALPGTAVAKAFNTLFAGLQANPDAHGTTLDALFATDDDHAREVLRDLITSIGFRAVDLGPLKGAREMEALAWLNIRLQATFSGAWNTAIVLIAAPAAATTEQHGAAAR
jgi:8-hydroxy-5-deazaflavin:NADPH oxidoreductase